MKKSVSLFICVLCILSLFTGCQAKADNSAGDNPTVGLPNPMVECASIDIMNESVGCNIKSAYDVYMNVTDESFTVIRSDAPIAQYKFLLDSIPVCIRAAVTKEDISGIYMQDGKHPCDYLTEDDPYAVIDTGYGLSTRWFDGGMQYSITVGDESTYQGVNSLEYGNLEEDVRMLRDYETYRDMPWYMEEVQETESLVDVLGYRSQIQDWNTSNNQNFGTGSDIPYASLKTTTQDSGRTKVEVSDVDSFLKAIAPNTEISLAAGTYYLMDAADYGRGSSAYYRWEETYDGYELVIENADNLRISGTYTETENGSVLLDTSFMTSPRYSEIIRFKRCNNLNLSGSVFGHTDQGECAGGVLALELCDNANILGCELYGCGVVGIEALNCKNMHVQDCIIHDCSYMHVDLNSCKDITFTKCSFLANNAYGGANMYGCTDITFDSCDFAYNTVNQLLYADGTDAVHVNNCLVMYNSTSFGVFDGDGTAFEINGGAYVDYSMDNGKYSEIAFG